MDNIRKSTGDSSTPPVITFFYSLIISFALCLTAFVLPINIWQMISVKELNPIIPFIDATKHDETWSMVVYIFGTFVVHDVL